MWLVLYSMKYVASQWSGSNIPTTAQKHFFLITNYSNTKIADWKDSPALTLGKQWVEDTIEYNTMFIVHSPRAFQAHLKSIRSIIRNNYLNLILKITTKT